MQCYSNGSPNSKQYNLIILIPIKCENNKYPSVDYRDNKTEQNNNVQQHRTNTQLVSLGGIISLVINNYKTVNVSAAIILAKM